MRRNVSSARATIRFSLLLLGMAVPRPGFAACNTMQTPNAICQGTNGFVDVTGGKVGLTSTTHTVDYVHAVLNGGEVGENLPILAPDYNEAFVCNGANTQFAKVYGYGEGSAYGPWRSGQAVNVKTRAHIPELNGTVDSNTIQVTISCP